MRLDGAHADLQAGRDHLVRATGGHQLQHLLLAPGERLVEHALGHPVRGHRIEVAQALVDGAHGVDDRVDAAADDHVAVDALRQRAADVELAVAPRQHHDARAGVRVAGLAQAAQGGQVVGDDDVGVGVGAVRELQLVDAGEQAGEPGLQQRVLVLDEHLDGVGNDHADLLFVWSGDAALQWPSWPPNMRRA